uniref:Methyltransferase domain-containing protein n=1 Tax=Trieres chinensis TaxID=1514140 RepID=A0A7S1ZB89_TRICV
MRSFDRRPTLSRTDAVSVYDGFAATGHAGGKDASSGYGGPAIRALLSLASFSDPDACHTVMDYGCGQGKLAELVLRDPASAQSNPDMKWRCIDQSPAMIEKARERLRPFGEDRSSVEWLESGEPGDVRAEDGSVDRFVSTYCLDLLSESDMYGVLDLAERVLRPESGQIILAGITWGYRDSLRTFLMTSVWEFLYVFFRRKVGGCRPQELCPYLKERGWTIIKSVRTLPESFPWMVSEVVAARPPQRSGIPSNPPIR